MQRKVLVTGAAGRIGGYFARHHDPKKYDLRLMLRGDEPEEAINAVRPFGEIVTGDLGDLPALQAFCQGIDTIVHMAGDPDPSATFHDLLSANIIGTYHIFAAAKSAHVRRVIYASSIHAVSGYAPDIQVKTHEPVNPGDMYGVSKCFGEALARYMAEKEGVSAISLRIGSFQPEEKATDPDAVSMMDTFVSHRDLFQLICRAIDDETITYAVFHGISNNRFKRLDISDAREKLGYAPEDDLTEVNPRLKDIHLTETVSAHSMDDANQKSGLRDDI